VKRVIRFLVRPYGGRVDLAFAFIIGYLVRSDDRFLSQISLLIAVMFGARMLSMTLGLLLPKEERNQ
jgi:hypothetical protein